MSQTLSSRDFTRPELVKFSGEVTEVRLHPTTHVSGYGGGFDRRPTTSSWVSQVGAMTVRVGGKPITCLIDMRTRNIGVMPGNTVTIWGRARVWKPGSNVPESVDVRKLACEETGEVHPQGMVGPALLVVPIVFCFVIGFIFLGIFTGLSDVFFFGGFPFIIPLVAGFALFTIVPIAVVLVIIAGRRSFAGGLGNYVEVGPLPSAPRVAASARKCIVCNLAISKADDVVYCPHCGNQAHREHMLEWLHTHDYCPVCEKHLDEQSFQLPTYSNMLLNLRKKATSLR